MEAIEIVNWRMRNLGLTGDPLESPEHVLRWLGLVQSQEFGLAKWSVAQRTHGVDDTTMKHLFNAGVILRAHFMRPTWHFVHRDDIHFFLRVTAPRVQVVNRHMYRRLELDAELLARCNEFIESALDGGHSMTRKEIGEILAGKGIEACGQRLAYILMNAELGGVVCSGPIRGKQHTYALVRERAPEVPVPDSEEALADVIRRYITSHGPATVHDCRSWSHLTLAEIRRCIEMLGSEVESFEHDGMTFWTANDPPVAALEVPRVHLIQAYDEVFMGYLESRGLIDLAGRLTNLHPDNMVTNGLLLVNGQFAGNWKRALTSKSVRIELLHYDVLDDAKVRTIQREADRVGAFLGRELRLAFRRL